MAVINRALRTDSERTRRNILASARQLCREQGYEHIRMADVAERVGCSRATVYNHFPSRDELLEALCVEFLDGYVTLVEALPAWIEPHHTVFDVLRETVARELRWRVEHGELRGALDSAKRLRKAFYVNADRRIDEAMLTWLGAIHGAAAAQGLLREDLDLRVVGGPVYAMSDSVVAGFPVDVPPEEIERVADQIARLQWHALFSAAPEDSEPFSTLGIDPASALRGRSRQAAPPVRRRRPSTPS